MLDLLVNTERESGEMMSSGNPQECLYDILESFEDVVYEAFLEGTISQDELEDVYALIRKVRKINLLA
jgi:hypothetical protein